MSMRHLKPDNRYSNPLARHGATDSQGNLPRENHQCSQLILREIENIIHFPFRDNKSMPLNKRIYIQKSQKLIVFRNLIAWNFPAYNP